MEQGLSSLWTRIPKVHVAQQASSVVSRDGPVQTVSMHQAREAPLWRFEDETPLPLLVSRLSDQVSLQAVSALLVMSEESGGGLS